MRKTVLIAQMLRDAYSFLHAGDMDEWRDSEWSELNFSEVTYGAKDGAEFQIHIHGDFYNVRVSKQHT